MTAPAWIGWCLSVAGLLAALGVIWTKAIRPAVRGFARLLVLLDTLLGVLTAWPDTQLTVQGHSAEITALSLHLGEIRAEHKILSRDVDQLWRAHRDGTPLPAPPGFATPKRRRREQPSQA